MPRRTQTTAVRARSATTLPPDRLTRISDNLKVKPDNCSEPMTSPANEVITTMSSKVRPVSSIEVRIFLNVGRVSFCRAPTTKVRMTVAMPALPASQFSHISTRSEEHTSELQSRLHLVCRLL